MAWSTAGTFALARTRAACHTTDLAQSPNRGTGQIRIAIIYQIGDHRDRLEVAPLAQRADDTDLQIAVELRQLA